jgi:hypothetical protein
MKSQWTNTDSADLNAWLQTTLGDKFLRELTEDSVPDLPDDIDGTKLMIAGADAKGYKRALKKIDRMRELPPVIVKGRETVDVATD